MADILESVRTVLEGPIDFPSQKFTEDVAFKALIAGATVASLGGFVAQNLTVLLVLFGLSVIATLAIVGPAYPGYNEHRVTDWVKPKIAGLD